MQTPTVHHLPDPRYIHNFNRVVPPPRHFSTHFKHLGDPYSVKQPGYMRILFKFLPWTMQLELDVNPGFLSPQYHAALVLHRLHFTPAATTLGIFPLPNLGPTPFYNSARSCRSLGGPALDRAGVLTSTQTSSRTVHGDQYRTRVLVAFVHRAAKPWIKARSLRYSCLTVIGDSARFNPYSGFSDIDIPQFNYDIS
ncbi:hypothetical protein DFH06DRAFT_1132142 [Mycena polygramma]|nr:hypothetical protein DFH06DRAFT_1132142 [Mycena polygramma]